MRPIIAGLLVFTALRCFAQPDEGVIRAMTRGTGVPAEEARRNYSACDSGITYPMKICGLYLFTKQDLRMNGVYKQVLGQAKELGYESSLVGAQRAWLAYRDTACAFEGQFGAGDGTAEGLYVLSCKEELTAQRADRLQNLLPKEPR